MGHRRSGALLFRNISPMEDAVFHEFLQEPMSKVGEKKRNMMTSSPEPGSQSEVTEGTQPNSPSSGKSVSVVASVSSGGATGVLGDAVLSLVGHSSGSATLSNSWSTSRLLAQGQASGVGIGKRVVFLYLYRIVSNRLAPNTENVVYKSNF